MTVNVEVPKELYERASEIARSQSVSVADVFANAFEEHVNAWELFAERARKGDRSKFLDVLANVPDVEPDEQDR